MKIAVIQDRPVFKCGNAFYRKSLTESEKYLQLCDHLFYCCTIKQISASHASKMKMIDTNRITIVELADTTVWDKLCISEVNKNIIKETLQKVDLTFVKMPSFSVGRYALHVLKSKETKYVTEVVGCAFDTLWYYSVKGKLLAIINYLITRYYVSKSKNVIYVTSAFLQKRYPSYGNSLSCSNVRIDNNTTNSYNNLVLENLNKGIMAIGTASPVDIKFRDQETVLRAIKLLKEKNIVVHYYLAGGGDSSRLKELALQLNVEEQVFFLGELNHNQVISFFNSIDVYVHPSKAEGLPRALIEAMSKGKLAIGAKTGGIPELLPYEYIFNKGDYHKLCDIISNIIPEDISIQGHLNYVKSLQFDKRLLDKKRKSFLKKVMCK
ncbi:MAG: glycosyltransferase [Bacteroides uniformis]